MNIKEVLNLQSGTEVKAGNSTFTVVDYFGMKLLHKDGAGDKTFMIASSEIVNAEYELVRKKLNFFEAMRLTDEGKVVESCNKYCKRNGKLRYFGIKDDEPPYVSEAEIEGDWYEVIE